MATAFVRQRVPPKRILLAEDDPIVAETIRMALAVDNHSVDIAEDGRRAIGMFDSAKYDLVITDFTMPNMDGLELAEALKRRSPATPIILLTAYLERIKGTGATVLNVDVLLGKPFSIDELLGSLLKLFPSS